MAHDVAGGETLRKLIRITRKEREGITQQKAAERAGLSRVYWTQVESGRTHASDDTLARMCYALGIAPKILSDLGYDNIAQEVAERQKLLAEDITDAEEYLLRTPGLDETARRSLISYLRALRETGVV